MLFCDPEGLKSTLMTFGIVLESFHAATLRSMPFSTKTFDAPGLPTSSNVSRCSISLPACANSYPWTDGDCDDGDARVDGLAELEDAPRAEQDLG